jgi:hypothetical protein
MAQTAQLSPLRWNTLEFGVHAPKSRGMVIWQRARYDQGEKEAPALVAAGFCTNPVQ